MKFIDLNVLLYATNSDARQHAKARAWWELALNGDEQIGLAWPVVLGFLRLTTRAGVLPRPLSPKQALDVLEEWIQHPLVAMIHPGDEHWSILRDIIESSGTAGNLTTDAHLAALAIEYDATLCSSDRDFDDVKGLRLQNPLK